MKKFIKFVLMGIGALVVLVFAVALLAPEETTVVKEDSGKAEEVKKSEVITKENYEKIVIGDTLSGEGGSTIEEVIAILGEPDDKMESTMTGINGEDFVSEDLSWYTADFDSIFINFVDGKVTFKSWNEN